MSHRARSDTDRFGMPFKVPEEFSETTTAILDTSLRLWGLAITIVCGWASESLFARTRIAARVSSNLGNIALQARSGLISTPYGAIQAYMSILVSRRTCGTWGSGNEAIRRVESPTE